MIVLDTCILIFDTLAPAKLSKNALRAIVSAEKTNTLYCCDISLWEIAMLMQKKRLHPGTDIENYLNLILQARQIQVLSITSAIATLAVKPSLVVHSDPADRIIAATATHYNAKLITCDEKLLQTEELATLW